MINKGSSLLTLGGAGLNVAAGQRMPAVPLGKETLTSPVVRLLAPVKLELLEMST